MLKNSVFTSMDLLINLFLVNLKDISLVKNSLLMIMKVLVLPPKGLIKMLPEEIIKISGHSKLNLYL